MVSSVFLVPCLQEALYNVLVNQMQVHVPHASEAKQKMKYWHLEHRQIYCRARQGEWVTCAHAKPKLPKGLQQNAFIFKLFSTVVYYKILNTIPCYTIVSCWLFYTQWLASANPKL